MRCYWYRLRLTFAALAISLPLLAPEAARGTDISYTLTPIVKSGDKAGNILISPGRLLFLGPLTDSGPSPARARCRVPWRSGTKPQPAPRWRQD